MVENFEILKMKKGIEATKMKQENMFGFRRGL